MSKLKLVITFGIGFLISFVTSIFMSSLFLKDVTDSFVIIIVNSILILVLTALINIPVYLYIIDNK